MKISKILNFNTSIWTYKNLILRTFSAIIYAIFFLYIISISNPIIFNIFIIILATGSIYEILQINSKKSIITFIQIIYIIISLFIFYMIKNMENGILLSSILLVLIWASDVGGYVVGSLFGKHKICHISPNKTLEGILGSILFCISVMLTLNNTISIDFKLSIITTASIICVASIAGDLIISKIKRINNKKESGFFLLGHGGFLDRLDSLYLASIIYYFVICI